MKRKELRHLFWRAGFGASQNHIKTFAKVDKSEVVEAMFQSSNSFTPLEIDVSEFINIGKKLTDKKLIQELRKKSNVKVRVYNQKWLERMDISEEFLREKMTLFWANHFVCKDRNIVFVQKYNNTLRQYALGNFGDFVKAIAKEPAMINYLNNKQNRKQKPNENFARELMELFTLGIGHYSEKDIKESARAFTGYNHDFEGNFRVRLRQHDEGDKNFMGETGNFNGEDIIDIILEQKECARFICKKIYSYFVNETVNEVHVKELANVFYKDYNIENLMRHLFMSDWFYDQKNIGTKIKSPIELLVGMTKVVPFKFKKIRDVLKLQKLLGQILLDPPNVAGWKGGKSWIDSNTIMLRLKLPSILLGNAEISVKPKGEFEDTYEEFYAKGKKKKFVNVDVDWEAFENEYRDFSIGDLLNQLIVTELNDGTETYLNSLSKSSKREYCIQLMSLPEYQMC